MHARSSFNKKHIAVELVRKHPLQRMATKLPT